jgi:hypothetical protein
MPEIGTYGLMSGDGKQGDAGWPKPLRLSPTLPDGRQRKAKRITPCTCSPLLRRRASSRQAASWA